MARFVKSIMILLLIMSAITACSGGDEGSNDNSANPPAADNGVTPQPVVDQNAVETQEPALPLDETGEQIVARVNGESISLDEFERAFGRQRMQADVASYDALAAALLDTMIEQRLINQAALDMGIVVTSDEVDTELQRNRSEMQSDEAWQSWLDQNGYTEDELRVSLRDWLLTQRVQEQILTIETVEITEVRARHIVVDTEEQANAVIQQLNAGEDFATLASTISKDVTTKDNGGDLGWFTIDGLIVPELAQAAFTMGVNEVQGPIHTMLGYHVIQLMEVQQREAAPNEEYTIAADQFNTWLQSLVETATIERFIN